MYAIPFSRRTDRIRTLAKKHLSNPIFVFRNEDQLANWQKDQYETGRKAQHVNTSRRKPDAIGPTQSGTTTGGFAAKRVPDFLPFKDPCRGIRRA